MTLAQRKETKMSANTETKKPVAKIRAGSVTASIWENEKGTDVTFQRSYKDKAGQWHNSKGYRGAALLELSKAALDAYDRLREAGNKAKDEAPAAETVSDDGAYIDDEVQF
jgi:hypothetical protein